MRNSPATTQPSTWMHRGVTAAMAGLALGGVVFWVAQMLALGRTATPVRFVEEQARVPERPSLERVLGGAEAPSAVTEQPKSTLALVAVIAQGTRAGAAMITVDGQKAQAYQPGDQVQPGRHVVELGPRRVGLGPSPKGPVVEVLELKVPRLPE